MKKKIAAGCIAAAALITAGSFAMVWQDSQVPELPNYTDPVVEQTIEDDDTPLASQPKVTTKTTKRSKTTKKNIKLKAADTKIDETCDEVTIGGRNISYVSYEYYMLNKPGGVVSATEDRRDTTVIDLIKDKKRKDLFPVGRLDKDTEGLLLITNDGDLAHRLLAPKSMWIKSIMQK